MTNEISLYEKCVLTLLNEKKRVQDYSLSSGMAGVLLNVANHTLFSKTKILSKQAKMCFQAFKQLNLDISPLTRGLWTSGLGMITAFEAMYRATSDEYWLVKAKTLYCKLYDLLIFWSEIDFEDLSVDYVSDVIYGLAGILMFVSNSEVAICGEKENFLFKKIVFKISEFSMLKATRRSTNMKNMSSVDELGIVGKYTDLGFSHGTTGFCEALRMYGNTFGKGLTDNYMFNKIDDILFQCNNIYFVGNSEIFSGNDVNQNISWCFGLTGRAIFLNNSHRYRELRSVSKKIQELIIYNYETFGDGVNNLSMCHGVIGALYMLKRLNLISDVTRLLPLQHLKKVLVDSLGVNSNFLDGTLGALTAIESIESGEDILEDWIWGY